MPTHAAAFRAFADFLEAHPSIEVERPEQTIYGLMKREVIHAVIGQLPSPTLRLEQTHEIGYLEQDFEGFNFQFVISRSLLAEPIVIGGKVHWQLLPEFQGVGGQRRSKP